MGFGRRKKKSFNLIFLDEIKYFKAYEEIYLDTISQQQHVETHSLFYSTRSRKKYIKPSIKQKIFTHVTKNMKNANYEAAYF